jgi:hypothetical protein
MTQEIAEYLANDMGRHYRALPAGKAWQVWCSISDHCARYNRFRITCNCNLLGEQLAQYVAIGQKP